jgi:hypothetical protein
MLALLGSLEEALFFARPSPRIRIYRAMVWKAEQTQVGTEISGRDSSSDARNEQDTTSIR